MIACLQEFQQHTSQYECDGWDDCWLRMINLSTRHFSTRFTATGVDLAKRDEKKNIGITVKTTENCTKITKNLLRIISRIILLNLPTVIAVNISNWRHL